MAEALKKAHERKWLKDPAELAIGYSEVLHRKGKGHVAMNLALKKRGLPAVDRNGEREIEKAEALLAKKFPRKAKLTLAERQKAYRFLAYRGFDSDAIRTTISNYGSASEMVGSEILVEDEN